MSQLYETIKDEMEQEETKQPQLPLRQELQYSSESYYRRLAKSTHLMAKFKATRDMTFALKCLKCLSKRADLLEKGM